MESETSPLRSASVPRYTFLGSNSEPLKPKLKKLQCCIASLLLALLITALIVVLWVYLGPNYNASDNSNDNSNNTQALKDLLQLKWPLQGDKFQEFPLPTSEIQARALNAGIESFQRKEAIETLLPVLLIDSPTFRHHMATATSQEAQEMSKLGFILNEGTKCIYNSSKWEKNKRKPRRWIIDRSSNWIPEGSSKSDSQECTKQPYRSANGTCNNLKNKNWGAALVPFRRILLPAYSDGVSEPRKASNGSELPSAREVSLAIHRPIYKNDVNFTVMLAVWGQFIDHDITATAISKGKNGSPISCCQNETEKVRLMQHPECFPVIFGKSDPFYEKYNTTCMNFVRSAPAPIDAFGPREQLNQVTSFLDASVVYGNNEKLMNELRSFTGGQLKMLKTTFGDLLPVSNNVDDGCNREEEFQKGRYCFLSGDLRSNENVLLTSMHLLFAREHNFIAKQLQEINSGWSDERIFSETRKIISAQIQHITYNEFLPSILPPELISYLNLTTKNYGYFRNYNASVDPTVANSFAAAAFRFGHTLLPGLIQFLHQNASHMEYIELHKMLFNPFKLYDTEFLEKFMKGAMNSSTEKADVYFNKELTQKLFQKEEKGPCGLDLVSLNIQRGRDHGIPSYPNWPPVCGYKRPNSFDDLRDIFEEETLEKLKLLYKSVEDLDLYTGALAEKPISGGLIGPTFTCLIADQFLRLKIGDRFWYETNEEPQRLTLDQLNEIRKITLAKVICRTSGVEKVQPLVMRKEGSNNNPRSCDAFSYPSYDPWKET